MKWKENKSEPGSQRMDFTTSKNLGEANCEPSKGRKQKKVSEVLL